MAETVKIEDATVPNDVEMVEEVPMIVHRETYMDGTVQKTREHGPMPVSEWPAYARKNGF